MKKIIHLWGLLLILAGLAGWAVMPALAQSPPAKTGPEFVPGEVLVKFKTQVVATQQATVQSVGGRTLAVSPYSGVLRVQVTPGQEQAAMATLAARPEVEFAEPNYILSAADIPNDPYFSAQWGLNNTGQTGGTADADIDAPEAWAIHTGGGQIIIAVVDSGLDLTHPDLVDRIWTNADEIPNNSIDDDGNGKIDDVRGWDFCNTSSTRCDGSPDNNPTDEYGHGSHVAGIVGATGNNGIGVTGVNWHATLMAVKVLDSIGKGTVASVADGIDYAANNGANVINLSLAGYGTQYPCAGYTAIQQAMQRARAKGVLMVVAAGNYGNSSLACPAAFTLDTANGLDQAVVAVGATDAFDQHLSISNYGSGLAVVAPGEDIYSTYKNSGYTSLSGTSMAAGFVSGLAGLAQSCSPALTGTQTFTLLKTTADDLGTTGRDNTYGYGRINAYRMLATLNKLQPQTTLAAFLLADNSPGPLPYYYNLPLAVSVTSSVSWTATISPALSWVGVGSLGGSSISGVKPNLTVPLVITRPTPAAYGVYSATLTITSQIVGGLPLCDKTVTVRLNYIPEAYLNRLLLIFKNWRASP